MLHFPPTPFIPSSSTGSNSPPSSHPPCLHLHFPHTYPRRSPTYTTLSLPATSQLVPISTLYSLFIQIHAHTEARGTFTYHAWNRVTLIQLSSTKFQIKLNSMPCLWIPACSPPSQLSMVSQKLSSLIPKALFFSSFHIPGSYPQGLCKLGSLCQHLPTLHMNKLTFFTQLFCTYPFMSLPQRRLPWHPV